MDLETARFNMVQQQIRPLGVFDPKLLELFESIPREQFVPSNYRSLAYSDTSIPIGFEQVMLPPKLVGQILQALELKPTDKVLEIGTGTGYVTCLLALLSKKVISVEIFPELSKVAESHINSLGLTNIQLEVGNGIYGSLIESPFDAMVFTGSLLQLPFQLREQISIKGKIFCILGREPAMTAMILTRKNKTTWTETSLFETVIPQLIDAPQSEGFVF